MEPGDSTQLSQGVSITSILSGINPFPRTDTYFFKIHSNSVLLSTPKQVYRPLSCRIATLTSILATCSAQLLDLINLSILGKRYKL